MSDGVTASGTIGGVKQVIKYITYINIHNTTYYMTKWPWNKTDCHMQEERMAGYPMQI